MSYTYILRDRVLNIPTQSYVAGRQRMNFFKPPVFDTHDDNQQQMDERVIEIDMTKEDKIKIIKNKRSIGIQTLYRESEAQTVPASLGEVEKDGTFLELLELKDFSYGKGLPVTMYELELIAKAREKRAFNDALPPLSDEACFSFRTRLSKEQEFREWTQKEDELKDANNQRILKLQQLLQEREKILEEQRISKIDELKSKKDEECETHIIKSRKKRVKIIRGMQKIKNHFNSQDKIKRDIINEYNNFGSKVYAPLTRDGHNPDRHPFILDLKSDHLTTYEGLSEIETEISIEQNNNKLDINVFEKKYVNSLPKREKVHLSAIEDAFKSIQKQEMNKIEEEKKQKELEIEKIKLQAEKNKPQEKIIPEISILEDILLFQRLLRGRKEQALMHKGKHDRAELIKELRAADLWKLAGEGTEEDNKLIDNYVEKLTNGVIDAIQGQTISQSLDFLSKQMLRIKEEQKINAIVMLAENERRKREAEEMGRRQAEGILRTRQDHMYKELLEVNQATMDSYLNSLFANTVNNVSKKQVMRELEIKANKLNKIVDEIENNLIKDDLKVRDLVSSFIIPEIERNKKEDKVELEEKRFIQKAQEAISETLKVVKGYIKK